MDGFRIFQSSCSEPDFSEARSLGLRASLGFRVQGLWWSCAGIHEDRVSFQVFLFGEFQHAGFLPKPSTLNPKPVDFQQTAEPILCRSYIPSPEPHISYSRNSFKGDYI